MKVLIILVSLLSVKQSIQSEIFSHLHSIKIALGWHTINPAEITQHHVFQTDANQ